MVTKTLKIESADKVGTMIDSCFVAADKAGQVVHDTAIQCLLHIQQHGNTGLMERLVDGLEKRSMNMRGLRFWAGTFTPCTIRAGKWALLDKKGDAYTKYVERNVELYGEGDLGVGDRLFWITEANNNPFWSLEDVQKDNGRNITRITTATLMGQVIGLDSRLDKSIEKGTFAGDKTLAEAFTEHMADAAREFAKTHKQEFRHETKLLEAAKRGDVGNENVADAADSAPSSTNAGESDVDVGGLQVTRITDEVVEDVSANTAAA